MLGCSARGHGIILSSIVIAILLGFVGSIARVGMTAVNHRCFDTPGGGGAVLGATLVLLLLTLIPRDGQDADDFGGGAGSGATGRGGGRAVAACFLGFLCLVFFVCYCFLKRNERRTGHGFGLLF